MTPAALRRETKRRNKQAAAARRQAARRRRQLSIAGIAAVAVLAVVAGVAWFFSGHKGGQPSASSSSRGAACASASASTEPSASTSAPASAAKSSFPPLPAGADPALATKPVVAPPTGTLSGIKVSTLIAGKGPATRAGQSLEVNYVGVSFKTCEEFDSSWKGAKTFTLTLGQGQVIKGWDQGLVGVKVGSRVQLDIPADLGYGEGDGPTNGSLRFVVDVLSAK
jgi:peptidylprolyl isomerase